MSNGIWGYSYPAAISKDSQAVFWDWSMHRTDIRCNHTHLWHLKSTVVPGPSDPRKTISAVFMRMDLWMSLLQALTPRQTVANYRSGQMWFHLSKAWKFPQMVISQLICNLTMHLGISMHPFCHHISKKLRTAILTSLSGCLCQGLQGIHPQKAVLMWNCIYSRIFLHQNSPWDRSRQDLYA